MNNYSFKASVIEGNKLFQQRVSSLMIQSTLTGSDKQYGAAPHSSA